VDPDYRKGTDRAERPAVLEGVAVEPASHLGACGHEDHVSDHVAVSLASQLVGERNGPQLLGVDRGLDLEHEPMRARLLAADEERVAVPLDGLGFGEVWIRRGQSAPGWRFRARLSSSASTPGSRRACSIDFVSQRRQSAPLCSARVE
jgi:hypothetical protein